MKKVLFWRIVNRTNTLMRKSIFLFLLFLLSHVTSFSQSIYSKENLEKASMEELGVYLQVSQKLKRTGTVMSVAGPAALIAGSIAYSKAINDGSWYGSPVGYYLILGGFVTTVIGVPVLLTGSSRVKRIRGIMDKKSVSFEIVPCSSHTVYVQNPQPGITLRLMY
jgi:hypothetical protein